MKNQDLQIELAKCQQGLELATALIRSMNEENERRLSSLKPSQGTSSLKSVDEHLETQQPNGSDSIRNGSPIKNGSSSSPSSSDFDKGSWGPLESFVKL